MRIPGFTAQTTMTVEEYEFQGGQIQLELTIDYSVSTYYPATMYRRNGDPGDPAEGGEVEVTQVAVKGFCPCCNRQLPDEYAALPQAVAGDAKLQELIQTHCEEAAAEGQS